MSERLQNAPMKALDYWVDCSVRQIWNAHSEHDARVNGTRLFKTLMNEIKTNADTVEKSHLQLAKDVLFFPFLSSYNKFFIITFDHLKF